MTTEQERICITKYDLLFESRLTRCETTAEHLDKKLQSLETKMDDGFKEIKSDLRLILVCMGSFCAVIISIIAKGFHWI